MSEWVTVNSEDDIEYLLNEYDGFHDSCLVSLNYTSGMFVDKEKAMHFGAQQGELSMIFHSQWVSEPLELCFICVRKYCIAGCQNRYGSEIYDCHLAFHNDLIIGRDNPLIVWADNYGFSPKGLWEKDRRILDEPMTSYVIAENLKWRWLEQTN